MRIFFSNFSGEFDTVVIPATHQIWQEVKATLLLHQISTFVATAKIEHRQLQSALFVKHLGLKSWLKLVAMLHI